MACKIIVGKDDSGNECACFYDSVTDKVFGELFYDLEEAESFQKWVFQDLRSLTEKEFSWKLDRFREERENNKYGE